MLIIGEKVKDEQTYREVRKKVDVESPKHCGIWHAAQC